MDWKKKDVPAETIKEISKKYACDLLTASILARRGVTEPADIQYYLESDKRYLRNPFMLRGMEDAVERILAAKDEGEKVLVFGDRDADGVTSIAIIIELLSSLGMDVSWKLPQGDEPYGLTIKAVEEFAAQYGTLIVTLDCGISNIKEIERANELNIDVVVTDHHRPQESLPPAYTIVDPKIKNNDREKYIYPFPDLAGCGVAYKLANAIRFALKSAYYGQSICLLNTRPANDGAWVIEVLKVRNHVIIDRLTETIVPGTAGINDTRLGAFLSGQAIFTWDAPLQKKALLTVFGKNVEFNMADLQPEIGAAMPVAAGKSLFRLKEISRAARYAQGVFGELDVFFNLFVSYAQMKEKPLLGDDNFDLQLAAIGTIADLMPLQNENRIIIRAGIEALNSNMHPGLAALAFRAGLDGRRLNSGDVSWQLCPMINSAGRMGKANISAQLLLEKNAKERDRLAAEIIAMDAERKELGHNVWDIACPIAEQNFEAYSGNVALAWGEDIPRGATGITANRLSAHFKVPSVVVSVNGETGTGSMRSARGYDLQGILDQCADLFIDWGGHGFAAGFTIETSKWDAFTERLRMVAKTIEFAPAKADADVIYIDAELPLSYMNPDIFKIVDAFQPYGKESKELVFFARGLKVVDLIFIGKLDTRHVKLTLDAGKYKWSGVYWNSAEKVNIDFTLKDSVDAVFKVEHNWFKGIDTPQLCIYDLQKHGVKNVTP
ncbi:MAG: single-stranded-DNA-specific exonuclease RecJ [Spirochaetaceae bacterium]|jgi:single-stranded-DNA-specific exonuclease|nr:single-stranded-DNA-specific exonuclease RecJ [Spirochaetaceae bacterium]